MDAAKPLLVLIVAGVMGIATDVAAQSWTGNTAAPPATTYDRYGQPITSGAASIAQRSSAAVQDGIDAGIRAAQQSVTTSINNNSSPWTTPSNTTPAASTWTSNPIAPSISGARTASPAVTPIAGGWTSIGTAVAPPPLLIPQSPMATPSFNSAGTTGTRNVVSYPAVASNDAPPLHSVLADPAKSAAPASPNTAESWTSGWGDTAANGSSATIRGNDTSPTVRDSGLAPLQPVASTLSDPWSQPAQPTLGSANGAVSVNRPPASPAANNNTFGSTTQPNNNAFSNTPQPNNNNFGGSTQPNTNTFSNTTQPNNPFITPPNTQVPNSIGKGEPQPWMPLIASVLTLAGSLAANLYLGVSYLDARQKYQSLVRKTADTFRRVKAVAA
jgi:hypothetical protein